MRVCHVVYAYFPIDPRVRREVFALQGSGIDVEVICLRGENETAKARVDGTVVHRVALSARRGGRLRYLFQYTMFFLLSSSVLFRLHARRPFDIVHVHSLPDFQVFCAFPLKILGVRVILDLHEVLPEIIAARFRLRLDSPLVRVALIAERLSISVAEHVLTVNDSIRRVLEERSGAAGKVTVVMNSPDENVARAGLSGSLRQILHLGSDPAIIYVGGINPERDLITLLRAVARVRSRIPLEAVIVGYGATENVDQLRRLSEELAISNHVQFLHRIPQEEVLSYLALSTVGVVPYEDNPLTRLAIPTKVFEYAAVGAPMIIADLPALRSLFDGAAEFYSPGDALGLANSIQRLISKPDLRTELARKARGILQGCSWDLMRDRLLDAYRSIDLGQA